MTFADIKSREAILKTVEEFNEIGRDAFLAKYGYGRARKYFLDYDGRLYDSKAIMGVAHGYEYPDRGPLRSDEFVSGKLTVKRKLEELGFKVRVPSETWNFEELRELCRQKDILESTIYQNSLEWRWKQADFFAEKAQEVWTKLFSMSPVVVGDRGEGDRRWDEAMFLYDSYVVACVQALHSMADILAQIINIVILNNKYSESRAALRKVTEFMKKQGTAPQVLKCMEEFWNSDAFSYLNAFCNTVKHRRLINKRYRYQGGCGVQNERGVQFLEFEFSRNTYPETWGSDILQVYRYQVRQFIIDIGLSINEFVAAI